MENITTEEQEMTFMKGMRSFWVGTATVEGGIDGKKTTGMAYVILHGH